MTAVSQAQLAEAEPASLRRTRRLLMAVALLGVAVTGVREVMDPDLWWHMATGRYILAQGRIPAYDVFSFTAADHRWVTHEWLSDLLLYVGSRLVGLAGLAVLFTLVIVAAYALVWMRCRGRPVLAAFAVVLAALAASPTFGVRPQMFSLLFASLYLYILSRPDAAGTKVWWLAPLTLLWANFHSGFVAGLAIVAVFAVGEELTWVRRGAGAGPWLAPQARQLALVWVACLACSLVTPNGVSALLFPFGTLGSRAIQDQIQEWASPNFHQSLAWPLGAYWLLLVAALGASRRRLQPAELLLLVGAGAAAMYSIRHVQFLSLVGAPILAERMGDLWGAPTGPEGERPLSPLLAKGLGAVAALLLVVAGVRVASVARRVPEVEAEIYPSAAVTYLEEHGLTGRVFNTYHWGGYLIWRGLPVFVDGRAEVYGDEVLNEYMKAQSVAEDWEEPLRRYGVEVALIQSDSPLAVVMRESGRWQAVYRDDLATVLTRVQAGS